MKYRNTIIWLVILLALGAYVYYFERTPIEETENGERKITLFPNFDSNKIIEFSLIGTDTAQMILCTQNSDSTWNIRSPVSSQADSLEINTFLSNFKDLKSDRVLKENLQSLSVYGLDTPHQTIGFKTSAKAGGGKLFVGIQNLDGSEYYVKKENDPAIYLIPSAVVNRWNKSPTDLRDKTVVEFPPDQVTQLTLTYPNQSLVFKKDNEDWKLTQPKPLDVNRYKIEDILWKLHSEQIKQFVDESPKDFKSYDLEKPALTAEIKIGTGKLFSISFSDKGPTPDLIYGKTSDKSFVFAVETSVKEMLFVQNLDNLRDRILFRFSVDDIQSLQIGTGINLSKEKEDWYLTSPKKIKADFAKVQDILWKINGLKIKDFIDDAPKDFNKYGLTSPSTKITLMDKNKKTYTLSLGNMTKTEDAIYGKVDMNPMVFSLDTDVLPYVRSNEKELIAVDTTKGKNEN